MRLDSDLTTDDAEAEGEMNDLVRRLTEDQPVRASLRPAATAESLKEAWDRGYVHVLFPNTRGGTELGVTLDPAASDTRGSDFSAGSGSVHLEGDLTLDSVRVRFLGDLDLATLEGHGRLQPLEEAEPAPPGA